MRPKTVIGWPRQRRTVARAVAVAVVAFVVAVTAGPIGHGSATSHRSVAFLPSLGNTFGGDDRFGVVVSGEAASQSVGALGLNWWYSFGASIPAGVNNEVAQIALRPDGVNRSEIPLATLQASARQFPGRYWIIGNEPNVPGQDDVTPAEYAAELEYYVTGIKEADPTARFVGPNVLNWDYTCSGCTGYTSGHSWVDAFRAAWLAQSGGEPPIDVWSIHSYQIAWDHPPMTDPTIVEQQISTFAAYLAAIPATSSKPIWLTEFGVIWSYDSWISTVSGCAAAPQCIAPVGPFNTAADSSFLTSLLTWLTSNSAQFRLNRWFLYSTIGNAEPYGTAYAGISLLDGTILTPLGQIYYQYSRPAAK